MRKKLTDHYRREYRRDPPPPKLIINPDLWLSLEGVLLGLTREQRAEVFDWQPDGEGGWYLDLSAALFLFVWRDIGNFHYAVVDRETQRVNLSYSEGSAPDLATAQRLARELFTAGPAVPASNDLGNMPF